MFYKAPLIRSFILLAAFYLIITETYFYAFLLIILSFVFQSPGSQGKKAEHYRVSDAAYRCSFLFILILLGVHLYIVELTLPAGLGMTVIFMLLSEIVFSLVFRAPDYH
ncbi:hypothetical protein ACM6N5_01200 [Rossellomorea marisflavi]|uniref:hypothetical protein n=1 Tax=Rossellomorea marisflavi TaxID=189381 RepID=UPI003ADE04B6